MEQGAERGEQESKEHGAEGHFAIRNPKSAIGFALTP